MTAANNILLQPWQPSISSQVPTT